VDTSHINKFFLNSPFQSDSLIPLSLSASGSYQAHYHTLTKDSDPDTNIIRSNEECTIIEYITYTPSDNGRVDYTEWGPKNNTRVQWLYLPLVLNIDVSRGQ